MTEITRVPLPPIAKGSLGKLWLGVVALALAGAGIGWAAMPSGVEVETVKEGQGPAPRADEVALVNYVGKLRNGKVFDQGREQPMPLAEMIPGFRDGLTRMKVGGKYLLTIPAAKAYGAEEKRNPQTGEVVIPANSDLIFEIDVLNTMSRADFERLLQMMQMQQMQQMQQHQGGGRGGPGGLPPGAIPPPQN